MPEYITLIGSEDVARAGRDMQSAASQMDNAAGAIEDSLSRFLRELESLVCQLENATPETPLLFSCGVRIGAKFCGVKGFCCDECASMKRKHLRAKV